MISETFPKDLAAFLTNLEQIMLITSCTSKTNCRSLHSFPGLFDSKDSVVASNVMFT